MKKAFKIIAIVFSAILIVAGIWFIDFKTTPLVYSNMADKETLEYASKELLLSGVPDENIEVFKKQVEDTNNVLGDYHSFNNGFADIKGTIVNYDEMLAFNLFGKALVPFDINCRVAAWNLIKDLVTVDAFEGDVSQFEFENGIFEYYENTGFSKNDEALFYGLFEPAPSKFLSTPSKHIEAVQSAWADRGVSFKESNRKLISCFAYDPMDGNMKAQHVGIMIEKDDEILFIEKLMPTLPFQISKFKDKDELENHIKKRFIIRFVPLILMENDQKF